jgi:hypothetical protein
MVSTLDFESNNPGSIPGRSFTFLLRLSMDDGSEYLFLMAHDYLKLKLR